jgi:hypothetical protein
MYLMNCKEIGMENLLKGGYRVRFCVIGFLSKVARESESLVVGFVSVLVIASSVIGAFRLCLLVLNARQMPEHGN